MQTTNSINRRDVLAAGAAVIAGSTMPAVASDHPDAALLELGRVLDPLAAEMAEASRRFKAAFAHYEANTPARPDALRILPGDKDRGIHERFYKGPRTAPDHYGDRDIDFLRKHPPRREVQVPIKPGGGGRFAPGEPVGEFPRDHELLIGSEPWPEAEARAAEIVAADDAHLTACIELQDACGLTACEAELDALGDRFAPIREAILDECATTMEGMAIKVRALLCHMGQDLEEVMAENARGAEVDGDAIISILWDIVQAGESDLTAQTT